MQYNGSAGNLERLIGAVQRRRLALPVDLQLLSSIPPSVSSSATPLSSVDPDPFVMDVPPSLDPEDSVFLAH